MEKIRHLILLFVFLLGIIAPAVAQSYVAGLDKGVTYVQVPIGKNPLKADISVVGAAGGCSGDPVPVVGFVPLVDGVVRPDLVGNYSYTWELVDPIPLTAASNPLPLTGSGIFPPAGGNYITAGTSDAANVYKLLVWAWQGGVIVSDPAGSPTMITISKTPTLTVTSSSEVCASHLFEPNISSDLPVAFSWRFISAKPNSLTSDNGSGKFSFTPTNTDEGSYTLRITAEIGFCSTFEDITFTVNPKPIHANIDNVIEVCATSGLIFTNAIWNGIKVDNTETELSSLANLEYEWSITPSATASISGQVFGTATQTIPAITFIAPGDYTVTFKSQFDNTTRGSCDSVTTFTVRVLDVPTVVTNPRTTMCIVGDGSAVTDEITHTLTSLTTGGTISYEWRINNGTLDVATGDTDAVSYFPTVSGTYTLYATPTITTTDGTVCVGVETTIFTVEVIVKSVMEADTYNLSGCTNIANQGAFVFASTTDLTNPPYGAIEYFWQLLPPVGDDTPIAGSPAGDWTATGFSGHLFTVPGTYRVVVTPRAQFLSTGSYCEGEPVTYNILIRETPVMDAVTTPVEVCEGDDNPITLASTMPSLPGVTPDPATIEYEWEIYDAAGLLTLPDPTPVTSGTGATINTDGLAGTTGSSLYEEYTVHARVHNVDEFGVRYCESVDIDFKIHVYKKPVVTVTLTPDPLELCSDETPAPGSGFTVSVDTELPNGTPFKWEVILKADSTSIQNGMGTLANLVVGTGNSSASIPFSAIKGTDKVEEYAIMVTGLGNSCPADTVINGTIFVAPDIAPATTTFKADSVFAYNRFMVNGFNFKDIPAGVKVQWGMASPADHAKAVAAGMSLPAPIPAGTYWDENVFQPFRAINTTDNPVNIEFVAVLIYPFPSPSTKECPSVEFPFTMKIFPSLVEVLDFHTEKIENQTVCSGEEIAPITYVARYAIPDDPTKDGSLVDPVFFHTKLIYGIDVLGLDNVGDGIELKGLSGAVIDTTKEVYGTYMITPMHENLQGQPSVFTITVKPTVAFVTPKDTTVTSGALIPAFSFESNVPGLAYHWKADDVKGTNLPAEGEGMFPQLVANNTTNNAVTVTYKVTVPSVTCFESDNFVTFKITVNPAAKLAAIADTTICSGSTVNIALKAENAKSVELKFVRGDKDWSDKIRVEETPAGSGVFKITSDALNNVGTTLPATTPLSSVYSVTPVSEDGTKGETVQFVITVNPFLDGNLITRSNKVYYNGDMVPELTLTGLIQGADYLWFDKDGKKADNYIGLDDTVGKNTMPAFTAINNTDKDIVATYQVGIHYNGCTSDENAMKEFTITVKPKIIADNNISIDAVPNLNFCANDAVAKIEFTKRNAVGDTKDITYKWEFVQGTNVRGDKKTFEDGDMSAFTAIDTNKVVTGTYRVTPRLGNGEGKSIVFSITVNPKATIAAITPIVVTNGALVPETHFTSDIAGLKYTWSTIDTGKADTLHLQYSGEGAFPSFPATNNTDKAITIKYTVNVDGCNNGNKELSITVNPSPIVKAIADTTICSGKAVNIVLNANKPYVHHYELSCVSGKNWGADLAVNAGGTAIEAVAGKLTNSGLSPLTSLYSVTPVNSAGVKGNAVQFVLTVNPALNNAKLITNVSDKVYNNGDVVPELTFAGHLQDATYTWIASGSAIGLGATAEGKNTMPSFVAINNGKTDLVATFKVSIDYDDCTGDATTFTITVKPKTIANEDITVDPIANVSVCGAENIPDVKVTGRHAFNSDNVTFKWEFVGGTNVRNDNVTSGSVDGKSDVLIMPATAHAAVTTKAISGTYRVTPCQGNSAGNSIFFTITVNPEIALNKIEPIKVTGGTMVPETRFSSNVVGLKYNWYTDNKAAADSLNLPANGETSSFPAFQAINNSERNVTVIYKVTAEGACNSDSTELNITVLPAPRVNAIADTAICAKAGKAEITVTGKFANHYDVAFVGGTKFDYTPATGSISENGIIKFENINVPNQYTPVSGRYSVTPVAADGTKGVAVVFTITVNPHIEIDKPRNIDVTSGVQVPGFSFSSNIPGVTYEWKLVEERGSAAIPNLSTSGDGTAFPAFFAVNNRDTAVTARYHVYALGRCVTPTDFSITIHPAATVNAIENQTICGGSAIAPIAIAKTKRTPKYELAFVEGSKKFDLRFDADTTQIVSDALSLAQGVQTPAYGKYSLTPIAKDGTKGTAAIFTITVNPTPTVSKPNNQVVCNGGSTEAVTFNGVATRFEWKVKEATSNLRMQVTSGTGNFASHVLHNAEGTPLCDSITVTPYYLDCPGKSETFGITVNPTPVVVKVDNKTYNQGELVPVVPFASNITDDPNTKVTYRWTSSNVAISGDLQAHGTGSLPAFTAQNTGTTPIVSTITVVATYKNGEISCEGPAMTFTITVNPKPVMEPIASLVVCNEEKVGNLTPDIKTGFGQGSYITWTGGSKIGLLDGKGQYIPSFDAVNTAANDTVVAVIMVTPYIENNGVIVPGTGIPFTITVNPSTKVNIITIPVGKCENVGKAYEMKSDATGCKLQYQWYKDHIAIPGATKEEYKIDELTFKHNGTYYVKVKGDCGQEQISETYIVELPLVNVLEQRWDDVIIVKCNPEENGGFTFTEFKWYPENSKDSIPGENKSYIQRASGAYYAKVKTAEGLEYFTCPLSIETVATPSITLYPNPVYAGESVQVKATSVTVTSIQVVNNVGGVVSTTKGEGEVTNVTMPSMPGIYIVRALLSGEKAQEFKVIVK